MLIGSASSEDPFTPFWILDKLIAAGLGDTPQSKIKAAQFVRAMGGEVVVLSQKHRCGNWRIPDRPMCPNCNQDEARVRAGAPHGLRRWLCRSCGSKFVA
jgi:uncharacterized OB-fold protein